MLPRLELDNRLFLRLFEWGAIGLISVFLGWWVLFSRVPWRDRIICILICLAAGCIIWPLRHPSIPLQYGALMYVV